MNTPVGMPARCANSARARAESGVCAAGRTMKVQPAAGDHGVGEIPRGNRGAHADGLADNGDALACVEGGDGVAVHALGFFGIPFDIGCAVGNFAFGFRERLALFGGEDGGEGVLVLGH